MIGAIAGLLTTLAGIGLAVLVAHFVSSGISDPSAAATVNVLVAMAGGWVAGGAGVNVYYLLEG